MYIIGRNALALTNAAHALNPTHSALPRTCRTTAPAPLNTTQSHQSFASAVSQAATKPSQSSNQSWSINQSVNQYPATTVIQSFAPHNTASPLSITHQLKRSVILRQPLFLSRRQSFCQFSLLLHMYVLSLARNAHITQQHSAHTPISSPKSAFSRSLLLPTPQKFSRQKVRCHTENYFHPGYLFPLRKISIC